MPKSNPSTLKWIHLHWNGHAQQWGNRTMIYYSNLTCPPVEYNTDEQRRNYIKVDRSFEEGQCNWWLHGLFEHWLAAYFQWGDQIAETFSISREGMQMQNASSLCFYRVLTTSALGGAKVDMSTIHTNYNDSRNVKCYSGDRPMQAIIKTDF